MADDYAKLKKKVLEFRNVRDWKQFHDPKNLAEGLSIEAAELLENFLWKTTDEAKALGPEEIEKMKTEIGDIFIFIIYLCEELGINLFEATDHKVDLNNEKYPLGKSKGCRKKYHEL